MRSNRSRDTAPELALRRAVFRLGLRYRVCARPVPGVRRTTDMVFAGAKVAVELRGCYWHGCPAHHRLPAANRDYWTAKVEKNKARDADMERILAEAGWRLIVVWEHEDPTEAATQIATVVRGRRPDPASARHN
jgi:DNA mismatch endonuclease (patch repair protein)